MNLYRRTRVLLVDDDPAVRDAYRSVFAAQKDFVLAGEARNGQEGVNCYATLEPDVVLMDLQMPVVSGVEATKQICGRWLDACVVVLTTFTSREHVVSALRAGAAGYLLKNTKPPQLMAGLYNAMEGNMPLSATVRRQLVATISTPEMIARDPVDIGLTPRERELLRWLAQRFTNHQIALHMYISEGSVKQYLNHIGAKMQVTSRTQILITAIQMNLVNPYETKPETLQTRA